MKSTKLMIEAARRRLDELDSGRVAAIPGDEVFEKVRRRLGINETPTRPMADGRSYAEILAARVAEADRGEFADDPRLSRTDLHRLEKLASAAGRTPGAMLRFVLRDGFAETERVVCAVRRGRDDVAAGRTRPHAAIMSTADTILSGRYPSLDGNVKRAGERNA